MSEESAFLILKTHAILVKWEGDPPQGDPDPIGHPKALEVLELTDDAPPKVLYRRIDDGTD